MVASIADLQNLAPRSAINISTLTAIKAGQGPLLGYAVLSGTLTGSGAIYDAASIASIGNANQIVTLPSTDAVGTVKSLAGAFYLTGLVVNPPPGGSIALFYG